jgi:hypothetical protein
MGDNFDAKYCNSADKMGQNTKERYEFIVRQDNYKEGFKDFFYYFNELDSNDKNNTRDRKKFYNPHLNINDNLSQIRSERSSISSSSRDREVSSSTSYSNKPRTSGSNFNINNQGGYSSMTNLNLNQNIQRSINEKINILNNIENKFSKIKILSSNNASRSAIKHYRHASTGSLNANNSTSNMTNNVVKDNINNNNANNTGNNNNNNGYNNGIHRRSGSTANFQY